MKYLLLLSLDTVKLRYAIWAKATLGSIGLISFKMNFNVRTIDLQ